jgi:hypothetical protein
MRFQSKAAGVAAMAATAIGAYAALRHAAKPDQTISEAPEQITENDVGIELGNTKSVSKATEQVTTNDPVTQLGNPEGNGNPHQRLRRLSRFAPYLVIISAAFFLCALLAFVLHHQFLTGAGLLMAMALSFFVLLKFIQFSKRRFFTRATTGLFLLQFSALAFVTTLGMLSSSDPVGLIGLTALGLTGLVLLLALIASRFPGWPYSEPIAVGLVAAALGALCFPGLREFTASAQFPANSGGAILFAAGLGNQKLTLNVYADLLAGQLYSANSWEGFSITTEKGASVRWALLLYGSARLKGDLLIPQIEKHDFPQWLHYGPVQLFSGSSNGTSTPHLWGGQAMGPFVQSTFDRSAVSLPLYGYFDSFIFPPSDVGREITKELGGAPVSRQPKFFTLKINGGSLPSLDSVSQSSPHMTINANNEMEWTSSDSMSPQFMATDQGAADTASNVLFVFAVLLGVAGAAFIASLQSFIHILSSRQSTADADRVSGKE